MGGGFGAGGALVGSGGVGREGERKGRRGGEGWAPLPDLSRLEERVTRGKRVGTERGVFAEEVLLRPLPLLELFFGAGDEIIHTHSNI